MSRSFLLSLLVGVIVAAVLWFATDSVLWAAAGLLLPAVWGGYAMTSTRRTHSGPAARGGSDERSI